MESQNGGMADGMVEWRNGLPEWRMEWQNGGIAGTATGMADQNGGMADGLVEWRYGGNGYWNSRPRMYDYCTILPR